MATTASITGFDPPASGRAGPLRIRGLHPDLAVHIGEDELTVRLIVLIRSHPGIATCRVEDVPKLDEAEKTKLITQFERELGLDAPRPDVLPFSG